MNSKIFKAIWVAAIAVFLASLVFVMGISYNYLSLLQRGRLRSESELAARGVTLSGLSYFDDLNTEDYRITWIRPEGSVLYDNEADPREMGNHLERAEVKQALATGYGEAERYSSTLTDKQLYSARLLPDGSVLRVSIVQAAV